jgi:hypothetical protein
MTIITEPGLYDIPADDYHADPCPEPSLSASIAKIMIDQSPWHGWTEHPRLNPNFSRDDDEKFDRGRVAHQVMLEGEANVEIIEANDWRKKEAIEAKEAAKALGKTPLLAKHWDAVVAMVAAARRQLAAMEEADDRAAFTNGKPEQTIVWREGKVWCRALLDWLPNAGRIFHDLKTTGASANPDAWGRTAYGIGADVQAGFYRRGIRAVLKIQNPEFRFKVIEASEPFALASIAFTPAALDLAERKALAAIELWRQCMETGEWPGYPKRTAYIDPPAYEEYRWLEREERERAAKPQVDALTMAREMQAPLEMAVGS